MYVLVYLWNYTCILISMCIYTLLYFTFIVICTPYIPSTGGKNVQSAVLRRQELAAKCGVTEREVEALVIEFNSMRKLMRQAFKVSLILIV